MTRYTFSVSAPKRNAQIAFMTRAIMDCVITVSKSKDYEQLVETH